MLNIKSKKYYDFNDFMGELEALCEKGIPGWDESWSRVFEKLCSAVSVERNNGSLIYFEPSSYLYDLEYHFDGGEEEVIRAKTMLEYIETVLDKIKGPGEYSVSLHFWW
jgi:hypothetical protein